ncbi:MAG: indole-3-glycerol phosphate synthase TrpC [Candidatus Omnitrophica bacterium]|nr:indole-3-glycerol phosphate synthase TrpC [Candidatus Omnitrophota bacterium]
MKESNFLKEILAKKKQRLEQQKLVLPETELKARIKDLPPARAFLTAINKPKTISLIAELKRSSPSHPNLRLDLDVVNIAKQYEEAEVAAISVLTEEEYFHGSLTDLKQVKEAVSLPVLRKDFIIEPYQVFESKVFGADAILLIAELLSRQQLVELISLTHSLGMDCLVESHQEKQLKKVLSLKITATSQIESVQKTNKTDKHLKKNIDFAIGINNRDLATLQVDLKTTEKLFPLVPKERIVVVESGINCYQDILFLKILGVNAVLVGTAILKSPDVKSAIYDLMGH